jgi:5-methylthioadenosine/S-adenosylhomocysteine deaminase
VIVAADTVVTLDDDRRVFQPGFVATEDGVITDVGHGRPGDAVDLGDRLLMPGLVNAHTHTPMSLFRGVAEGHSLLTMEGWYDTIRTLELYLTADMIAAPVELSCAEMIATGTTGFADQYFFADRIVPVVRRSGLRATIAYGIVELGDAEARAAELDRASGFLRSTAADELVSAWIGPHAFFVDNTEESIAAEVELAESFSTGLHTHFSTTGEEHAWCMEHHGMTALQRLDQLGVLDHPLVMAHCLDLDDHDLHLVARSGSVLVLIASVAMASGVAAPPVRRLLDAGVTVAIGTDNMANNGSYDLFEEMRTLSRLTAFSERRPAALSSAEVLAMATRGGAAALGRRGGALAEGYDADLIALDPSSMQRGPSGAQPVESAIVWGAGGGCVTDTMVAGRWLQRDRVLLTVDHDSARVGVEESFERLRAAAAR